MGSFPPPVQRHERHDLRVTQTGLLGAIAVLVNGAKGVSALQLSRCTGLSYKTPFVLAHKIREALARETESLVWLRSS